MPRWLRTIRGMIGTGLMFGLGIGAVSGIIALVAMLFGELTPLEVLQVGGKLGVVGFIVGVGFSGVMAFVARGRAFEKLKLGYVTALGAGGGLLYFLFIALNAWDKWTPMNALGNFLILTVMGAAAAACTFLIASRGTRALDEGDGPAGSIGAGDPSLDIPLSRAEQKVRR